MKLADQKHKDARNLAKKMFKHVNKFHDELLRHENSSNPPTAGPEKLSELLKLCEEAGFTPNLAIADLDTVQSGDFKKETRESLERHGTFLIFSHEVVWEIVVVLESIAYDHRTVLDERQKVGLKLLTVFFEYLYI
jgi:hypothetical protein